MTDYCKEFLEWMTNLIHTQPQLRNVGMIEILNEPIQDTSKTQSMLNTFYPTLVSPHFKLPCSCLASLTRSSSAYNRIRAAESALSIASNNLLHIQVMNEKWGSGNPNQALTNLNFMAYDDHRYLKWAYGEQDTQSWYLNTACNDDRGGNWPTVSH